MEGGPGLLNNVLTEHASPFGLPSKKNVCLNFSTFSDSEVAKY